MSIQAMKQALYFLDRLQFDECDPEHIAAITALRAAIEAAEKQEPVAIAGGEYPCNVIWYAPVMAGTKLYTRPQPAIPESWYEELELIRAVLDGFQPCMAKSDGLRAVHKLLAAAPKPENSHD